MSRVFKLPRRINPDVRNMQAQSLDEQIANIFGQIMTEIEGLEDPRMRDLWMDAVQTFITTGDVQSLERVTRWRRPVVDLDEFLFGDAFLGIPEDDLYPGVVKALHDVDSDHFDMIVEQGALGIGKTTFANIGSVRDLYKLSCLRNPQQTYGLQRGTKIQMTFQSIRLGTAKKVVFEEIGRYIKNSPYFREKFRYNPLITSSMIFPEFNIELMPISSSTTAAISMNVIGGQLDEMNFMQKTIKSKSAEADAQGTFDQAKELFNKIADRRESRFTTRGDLPGTLYLISSSRFPDDFTAKKAEESTMKGGTNDRIYVFEGSQWAIKGRNNPRYFPDPRDFKVQVGNESYPSKVVEPGEIANKGCEVIDVPMNFYQNFKDHPDDALRNFAGMTTLSTAPFFSQRDKITEAIEIAREHGYENPMALEEVELSQGMPALDKLKVRTDVKQPRYAHIDLGVSGDACGLAVGHLAGHKVNEFTDEKGKKQIEVLPVIAYDIILRIVKPLGGEIQLEDVRKFLRHLNTRYRLNIEVVTFDGFQSVDSRQLLAKQGFKTGKTSVEGIEPWRTFRDALYDGRVLLVGHNYLKGELSKAEKVITNSNKEKVDHPTNGTKDVADGVVGVAANIFRKRMSWSRIALKGGKGLSLYGDRTRPKRGDNVSTDRRTREERPSGRPSIQRRSMARR